MYIIWFRFLTASSIQQVYNAEQEAGSVLGSTVLGVVEEAAAPHGVLPAGRSVEEAGVRAVEAVQAVLGVLGGVAVDAVQQHHDAHGVSHVDQLLQLVRGAVATAGDRFALGSH